jgi:hypothetical protein
MSVRRVDFGDLSDIAGQIEVVAAQVRAGSLGDVAAGVCVLLDAEGLPRVFGWGRDTDDIRAIGLLHLGASWLSAHAVRRK